MLPPVVCAAFFVTPSTLLRPWTAMRRGGHENFDDLPELVDRPVHVPPRPRRPSVGSTSTLRSANKSGSAQRHRGVVGRRRRLVTVTGWLAGHGWRSGAVLELPAFGGPVEEP